MLENLLDMCISDVLFLFPSHNFPDLLFLWSNHSNQFICSHSLKSGFLLFEFIWHYSPFPSRVADLCMMSLCHSPISHSPSIWSNAAASPQGSKILVYQEY